MDEPRNSFYWPVYADATFAGLAVLIPIPLLDMLLEWIFRNRMPAAIAGSRGKPLDRRIIRELNRVEWTLAGCLLLPLKLVLVFLKRLYRTILYFLTIKDATDKLSLYWHRAFLIDHALRRGDLIELDRCHASARTIQRLLEETRTSPVNQLAGHVVSGAHHVLRAAFRRLRRGTEDEVSQAANEQMGRGWTDLRGYFDDLAVKYDELLREVRVMKRPGQQ
ncbi:hypothetical protein ABI59_15520 [Acidobacteria bacterium Mor1]|nr:hypothetical protein ABI59_15520 [Acidobacteria bacterium Mor1]